MKALCDICSGELIINAGGNFAVCENCSMKHSIERVREKLSLNTCDIEPSENNEANDTLDENITYEEIFNGIDEDIKDDTDIIYEASFEQKQDDIIYNASYTFEDNDTKEEIYEATYTEDDENIEFYKAEYSDDDLYKLEGRDIGLGNDKRSFDELCDDIYACLKSPIFSGYEIKKDVSASSYGASDYAMNITFMLFKDGKEALAVLVRKSLSKSHRVVKDTMDALSKNKIPFVDFVQTMPNTQFYIKRKIIQKLGL